MRLSLLKWCLTPAIFATAHLVTAATTERPNAELRTLLVHAINDAGSFGETWYAQRVFAALRDHWYRQ